MRKSIDSTPPPPHLPPHSTQPNYYLHLRGCVGSGVTGKKDASVFFGSSVKKRNKHLISIEICGVKNK